MVNDSRLHRPATKTQILPSGMKREFSMSKLSMSLDYIFGEGTSNRINFRDLEYHYSRKTGRLRYVLEPESGKVLFSLRANGTIAPTVEGARLLLNRKKLDGKSLFGRPRYCVTVVDGVSEHVSQGKTVFCKHVVTCDKSLRAGEDVVVLNQHGSVLAVGKSVVPCQIMKQFKRGVAVKVREGIDRTVDTARIV